MDTPEPVSINRLDYQPLPWQIDRTQLRFELEPYATRVHSVLSVQCLSAEPGQTPTPPLRLDGMELQLESLSVDGVQLRPDSYVLDQSALTLSNLPARCDIAITTLINPQANTSLEGLYRSSGNFCTQCEAEGFRKITFYPDRPDVLSVFDVTIEANQAEYPILLSNGNLVEAKSLGDGMHSVSWHDPHPKPSYLFALVAGNLALVEDSFVTQSGRSVLLQIYVQSHNVAYCDFAMTALKKSMRWDEQVYGLEYDLERFMIVAVDDFNMGAMENKGLNIFNSRYVLADRDTATDADFLGVEAVIAHEYFHNWTGNRITCRDWFQLSLKEGLTVFRDQCFSSDMHSASVKRIEDVRLLRARQFAEDASPMAHPIRPDSFIEINNFYTLTVYEKGAEVIRMLHTLLGPERWRLGMDEYVRRHDGSATTCDAFLDAMQSVTEQDLTQFALWYSVAGTPQLSIDEHYDASQGVFSLTITQQVPDTPGQRDKPALHIPVSVGLLDEHGNAIPVHVDNDTALSSTDSVLLNVTKRTQRFDFRQVTSPPTASVLRGFTAPVKIEQAQSDAQLALLAAHDTDAFNRWEAVQRLGERVIMTSMQGAQVTHLLQTLNNALDRLLDDKELDDAFKAEALQLPTIDTLAENFAQVDFQALSEACAEVQQAIARHHEKRFRELICHARDGQAALMDDKAMGVRRLANTALSVLSYLPEAHWSELAREQFVKADNMTDKLAALACLCHSDTRYRNLSLDEFYCFARPHKLVLDKWFGVQAGARRSQIIDDVLALCEHKDFDLGYPNRIRALIGGFAMNNPVALHAADGRGYALVADKVIALDSLNPQIAARLVIPLTRWRRIVESQQPLMLAQLNRIKDTQSLSADVYELVSKALV